LQMPEAEAKLASKDRESVQIWYWASSKINGPARQALESTNGGDHRTEMARVILMLKKTERHFRSVCIAWFCQYDVRNSVALSLLRRI